MYTEKQEEVLQESYLLCEAKSAFEKFAYNQAKLAVNIIGSKPLTIVLNNAAFLANMRKRFNAVKTEDEREKLIALYEKNLRGFSKNKNHWINKGNIIPGLDKKIKADSIDKTIGKLEDLLEELKQKEI